VNKIIFTVTNDLSYDQRMIRICSTLAEAGYDVTLVGRKKKSSVLLSKQPFRQKRLNCFFEKGKQFYAEYNLRLFFYLLSQSFDAICAIDLDTLIPGYLASRLKGKPCVYDAHEYFTELPEVINRPFTKKVWSTVARRIVPKLQYCYTVCESLAEIFTKEYGPYFEVIRNVPFVSDLLVEQKPSSTDKVMLYQGALNDGRGIKELLLAMPEISNARLWLVGEGDLSDELRALSQQLNLGDRVTFYGYILPAELKAITLKADIGLNLLENKGLNYYYSLANKAFDYVQAEIPSVNMDFPEYQKLNAQYRVSILLSDLETTTIASQLNDLIQDQELYQSLVQNTRKAKLEWNWEQEKLKLLQFYKEVV